jgi:hypothetical protein
MWKAASLSAKISPDLTYASLFLRSCSRRDYVSTIEVCANVMRFDDVRFKTLKVFGDYDAERILRFFCAQGNVD